MIHARQTYHKPTFSLKLQEFAKQNQSHVEDIPKMLSTSSKKLNNERYCIQKQFDEKHYYSCQKNRT